MDVLPMAAPVWSVLRTSQTLRTSLRASFAGDYSVATTLLNANNTLNVRCYRSYNEQWTKA